MGSHHQTAMQSARASIVLGNFETSTYTSNSASSTFFRRGERYYVRTEGEDGALHDFEIGYTFGIYPLQQYLIAMPGGRLQALGVAWDSRPREQGGQRWFSLYPDHKIPHDDPLHWTGIDQTWNHMCADCHSTNVRKNYNLANRSYTTTYAAINVACEACHGPGSNHLKWATRRGDWQRYGAAKGLTITLDERRGVGWSADHATGEPRRSVPRRSDREIDTCARCHSRREQIHEDVVHGQPIGDGYRVAVLDEGLYFPDGQIKEEVYEYGSFIQSRMYAQGVTCGDCHDPHSQRLKAQDNALCIQCHSAAKYDTARHHFHKQDSAGAKCVSCHMPTRTYMVIDQRRDHSIRIPRPDLSSALGTPNACNQCHMDKTDKWAADSVKHWYGNNPTAYQSFGKIFHDASEDAPGVRDALTAIVTNRTQPAIARASALSMLSNYSPPASSEPVIAGTKDSSALVRRAAAGAVSNSDLRDIPKSLEGLLTDPVRSVRLQAAQSFASASTNRANQSSVLARATDEYVSAQSLNADRPEAHLNLGMLHLRQRNVEAAKSEFSIALSLDPSFSPAAINLADVYREQARDGEGEVVLRTALRHSPNDASLNYAAGLLMVREKRRAEAFEFLKRAVALAPSDARYGYVYAVALSDSGDVNGAIKELDIILATHPYDRDSLSAIALFLSQSGQVARALHFAERLLALDPDNPEVARMVTRLKSPKDR
jgi:predicted CXXCH cytochrome family protein